MRRELLDRDHGSLTKPQGSSYDATMAVAENKCAKQRFFDFLSGRKLRLTAQRRAIVETAFGTRKHFTAEELLGWSRCQDK